MRCGGASTARFRGEDGTALPVIPSLSPSCSSFLPPLGFLDLGSPFIIPRPSEAFLLIDSCVPLMSLFVFEFSISSVARCHKISLQRRRPCRCGRRRHAARRCGPLLCVHRLEAAAAVSGGGRPPHRLLPWLHHLDLGRGKWATTVITTTSSEVLCYCLKCI